MIVKQFQQATNRFSSKVLVGAEERREFLAFVDEVLDKFFTQIILNH
jgi:hypothetical protein